MSLKDRTLHIQRYKTIRLLGKGGFGDVYLGWDCQLERHVALKIIRKMNENLLSEAKALAKFSHENIVAIYDIIEWEGHSAIVMEYVESDSPFTLESLKYLPIDKFLEFYTPLLDGVDAIHSAGLLHGDIKISNILLDKSGKLKLTDFGLSQYNQPKNHSIMQLKNKAAVMSHISRANNIDVCSESVGNGSKIKGSWECLSPEQLQDQPLTTATDVFSLGIILFSAIYGCHPFEVRNDPSGTRKRLVKGVDFSHYEVNNSTLSPFVGICREMLGMNPKRRPSVHEVKEVFSSFSVLRVSDSSCSLTSETLEITPSKNGENKIKNILIFLVASIALCSFIFVFFGDTFKKPKATLVIPTLIDSLDVNNQDVITHSDVKDLLAEKEKALAIVVDDGLMDSVLSDTKRRLVSKREWRGDRNWHQVAESLLVDEIIFGEVSCQKVELCTLNIFVYNYDQNKVVQNKVAEVPSKNILEMSEVVQTITGNILGKSRVGQKLHPVSDSTLKKYLEYRTNSQHLSQESLLDAMESLVKNNKNFDVATAYLGRLYLEQYGRTKEVVWLKKTKSTADLIGNTIGGMELLYGVYLEQKKIEKARAVLKQLGQLPAIDHTYLVLKKSMIMFEAGEKQEAIKYLLQESSIRKNERYFHTLAYMYKSLARYQKVFECVGEWLKLNPSSREAQEYHLISTIHLGKLDEALSIGLLLNSKYDNPLVLENLSLIYLLKGNFKESIAALSKLMKVNPDNRIIVYNLAEAYLGNNNIERANQLFYRFIEITTELGELQWRDHAYLAQAYAHLGYVTEALLSLQDMSEKALMSDDADDGMYYLLSSYIYALLGQNQAAVVNGVKALKKGQGYHWFNLPWLTNLRKGLDNY